MDSEMLIFFIGLVVSVFSWFAAILVWAIWIQRYVDRNGKQSAPVSLTFFGFGGFLLDYRKAREIAAQHGRKPWFLSCFELLAGLGLTGLISIMTYICVSSFH
jgi:hypothetical protein